MVWENLEKYMDIVCDQVQYLERILIQTQACEVRFLSHGHVSSQEQS